MNDRAATGNVESRHLIIQRAITRGTSRYIAARRMKVNAFVKNNYSFRGALRIHSHALGWDLIRVPVNVIWSIFNIVLAFASFISKRVGWKTLHERIGRIPPGLETDMDKEINRLIITELLELPYQDVGYISEKDALMQEIMRDPVLQRLLDKELGDLARLKDDPRLREELERKLKEYSATRLAAADLASNVLLLVSSKIALGNASFGVLSAGSAVSASIAQAMAVSNFWLGSVAGAYWYALFPVAATARFVIAVTAVIAIIVALASTFIGIITDPIQAKLGWHQKRLQKLVSAVEQDLLGESIGPFQLREKYVGRILDVVDALAFLRSKL